MVTLNIHFKQAPRASSVFTLVEMLVVIAILLILMSLLLPSLRKSLHRARFAVCASQQHQISAALDTYLKDYFQFPPGNVGTQVLRFRSNTAYCDLLGFPFDQPQSSMSIFWEQRLACYLDSTVEQPIAFWGTMGKRTNGPFRCPEQVLSHHEENGFTPAPNPGSTYYAWQFWSYGANYYLVGDHEADSLDSPPRRALLESEVTEPAQTMFATDGRLPQGIGKGSDNPRINIVSGSHGDVSPRHSEAGTGDFANVVFVDGHVQPLLIPPGADRIPEYENMSHPPGPDSDLLLTDRFRSTLP